MSVASLDIQGLIPLPFGGNGLGLTFFPGCDPSEAVRLERVSFIASFHDGDIIARSNIDRPFYGFVERGAARSYFTTPIGRQYTTGLTLRGQLIPPVSLAAGKTTRTVEATLDTLLYSVPAEQIHQMLRGSEKMGTAFRQLLSQTIESNGDWVALLGRRTVGERIAAFLVLLMEHAADRKPQGDIEVLHPQRLLELAGEHETTPPLGKRDLPLIPPSQSLEACRSRETLDRPAA
jgi:CRP-like cAMP-binding protein